MSTVGYSWMPMDDNFMCYEGAKTLYVCVNGLDCVILFFVLLFLFFFFFAFGKVAL